MSDDINPWVRAIYSRAIAAADPAGVPIRFHATVLDRYRRQGLQIKRTDTVGRIKKPGGWSLDFGIGKDDLTVHTSFQDLAQRLPEEELQYWVNHVAEYDLSENYLKMRLHPGSCIDDGDLRDW